MAKRGTSNAPLILGIVGALISLPNVLCLGMCGAVAAGDNSGATLGFVPVVLGFIAAFLGKSKPALCGILMIICAVLSLVTVILTAFTSIFGWAALILFIIAGIYAFIQPMEETEIPIN